MIKTPLSTVIGGAFWTPEGMVLGGTSKSFDQGSTSKAFDQPIKSLFTNGEQGFVYDPNDLSTMYQDSAGTVPVTGVGQPVGLITDKSGRNNHARQTASASRPTLRQDATTGANYLEFDGADDYLIVPKTNLKFLHDGTGANGFIGFKPSSNKVYQILLDTGYLGGADFVGYALCYDNRFGKGAILNLLRNGSRRVHVNNSYTSGSSANPRVVSFSNKVGTHVVRLNSVVIINSSSEVGTPSSEASTNDLWIGQAPTGYPFRGNLYGLVCVNRFTTTVETLAIEKELANRTGATLSV